MALEGISKHPDLWFEDGNTILIAETTGFCVYWGVLARRSEVFRDMFQIPQPPTVDGSPEGYRIVHLSDDGADEVAIVLELLFGLGDSFYRNTVQVPFSTVAAALRLGMKYGLEKMKQEALRRLSVCYAKDLAYLHTGADDCSDPAKCPITWQEGDCIAVLHLSRQFGLDDLIPAALYRCANDVSIKKLVQAAANDGRVHTLSFQELEDCMQSRRELLSDNISLYRMFSAISADCAQGSERVSSCRQTMKDMVMWAYAGGYFDSSLALHPMDRYVDYNTGPDALCSHCGPYLKSVNAQMRKEIWSRLRSQYCAVSTEQIVEGSTEE